jgi:4-methylaminobutanoate oxidase (formaldehyde-forming)
VEKTRAEGPRRRLVSFAAADPETMMWGGELVLRDGVAVGQVTSAAWGAALGATAGLAYVWDPTGDAVTPEFVRAGSYQVNVGGDIRPVTVSLRPPFDPAGERVRGGTVP